MYRDDRLEFNKGSLLVKKTETSVDTGKDGKTMQKQRRSTKFDFSGTNYEVQTLGYLAGIEDEHQADPSLFMKICDKAKQASGARKPAGEVVDDKFASMRLDPAFLSRASLRAKISGRAIHTLKATSSSGICANGDDSDGDDGDDGGDEREDEREEVEEVMDGENAGCEATGTGSANEDNDNGGGASGDVRVTDHSGGDFEGELTDLVSEEGLGDEGEYALTEDGSQA
jgi:hypothetical protein